MTYLLSIKKTFRILTALSFFFIVIFTSPGCHRSQNQPHLHNLDLKKHQWLNKFFHDLLFEEQAIFTLWGSKPITEIVLYHYTDEEMNAFNSSLSKEELENCYVNERYDLPENWENWEKIQSEIQHPKYLLFRSHYSEDRKCSYVYFVNIMKTAFVLQKHYELFRNEVGYKFHPLEVVLEMPDDESNFWKQVRNSENGDLLWGILFGFGEENSRAFHWEYTTPSKLMKVFLQNLRHSSNQSPKGRVVIGIDNFEIPSFVSYVEDDEVVAKYEKEKEEIRHLYQKADLIHLTLSRLTAK